MPKMTCKAVSSCGPTDAKLSQKVDRCQSLVAKFSQGCAGLQSLQPSPQRENLWDQMVELWSQRKWVSSSWSCCSSATCDIFTRGTQDCVIISNHICLVEINNNYSCWLGKNRNGNGIEELLILGAFLLESSWWSDALRSSKHLKALLLILCTVRCAGWMDCLL